MSNFRSPQIDKTPKLLTVKMSRDAEIAYWFLQGRTKPNLKNYPEIEKLLSDEENNKIPAHALSSAMRMGIIFAAYIHGCRHPELLEAIRGFSSLIVGLMSFNAEFD